MRLGGEPIALVKNAGRAVFNLRETLGVAGDAIAGLREAVSTGLQPASETPLNRAIGPHRRFDWTEVGLRTIKKIRDEFGGTVNDIVLTVVSGAVGTFLRQRGVRVEGLDFRAMVPVNTRESTEREALGNRIAMLMARLPIAERDPLARLRAVRETTRQLKGSKQALGVRTLEELSDLTLMGLFSAFAKVSTSSRAYNLVVTNVAGPRQPAYLLGSKMRCVYPLVPLNRNQALGIAVFSYNGRLFWGFNSDWDTVPDLHTLVEAVDHEFDELEDAVAASPPRVGDTDPQSASTA
jgi:WS/DGAT/MGAT family acyltransferase